MKKIDWAMVIILGVFAVLMIAALVTATYWTVENKLYVIDFSQSIDWAIVGGDAIMIYFCVTLAFLFREIGREFCPAMN